MKVLMTADTVGGVWTYAIELIAGLRAYGIDVVLATMGAPASRDQRREIRLLDNAELVESRYKLEWMDDAWSDVDRAGQWLLALEAAHRPDLVHLNGYAHGALPWSAPVLVAGHSCVRSWWAEVKGCDAPPEWNEYTRRVRAGLQKADLVVAPTKTMLGYLVDFYGEVDAAVVIPNGRSSRLFSPGLKENMVFSAGRLWDEGKNVAALAAVADQLPWPVVIAGSLEAPGGGTLTLSNNVRCVGRVASPDVAGWMARSAIYALPARYEPFGLSAVEAGLCGCTLVLGDIPSLREVWGDAAAYVPPDDRESLRDTIDALCDDPGRRRLLARRARARAIELSARRMALQYMLAYQQLEEARQPGAEATACAS